MTVKDLFEAFALESANDAAVTLAEGISGTRDGFVAAMNGRAEELGLDNTSYANPIDSTIRSTTRPRATCPGLRSS